MVPAAQADPWALTAPGYGVAAFFSAQCLPACISPSESSHMELGGHPMAAAQGRALGDRPGPVPGLGTQLSVPQGARYPQPRDTAGSAQSWACQAL